MTAQIPSQPPAAAARAPERRYFEVFGDSLAENVFLRNLVIVLAGACIVLTIATLRLANKPPLVIRVDRLSAPAVFTDARQESVVTAPEVRNFAEHFTRDLLAWDAYTIDDDINRALAMMTPEAAIKMKQRLDGMSAAQRTRENTLRTKIVITEIVVEKDAPRSVRVKVRGTRIAESYDKKDYRKETIFEDTLVGRKVDRSFKTPWGLLVEDWNESIYKETP
jgi:hypothetical protein